MAKANILLVDDHPENLLALEAMLEDLGENLVRANSGEEALKCLLDMDVALILLDVQMPSLDGFETAALIKQRERTQHIPIIFITAINWSQVNIFQGYSLGAVDYLLKPVVPEILRTKVSTFVELFRKTQEVRQQSERIEATNAELQTQLQEVRRLNRELNTTNQTLQREVWERQCAENALREMHDNLEQRVRERTAELQALNEEVTAFTFIVSHDLRSPLVNLKGFAGELRDCAEIINSVCGPTLRNLPDDDQERVAQVLHKDIPEAVEYISSAVSRMDYLTSAVLKLARVGRRELIIEPVDVQPLVQNILNSLAHQIKQRQAEATVHPLPTIMADRMSIEQIMGNLLTNAVIYLNPDRPGQIEVGGEERENDTLFYVRDNGRGIAESDSDKIFEPFRRASPPDIPGEGMGLAYVQALVRRHGGRIWFESVPGEGTTFYFSVSKQMAAE